MQPNFEQPEFSKIYFLITWASQYHYQQIPGNSPVKKFFVTKIHGESQPISTHILETYLMTQYFTREFSRNALVPKLPNISTRGLYHVDGP